MRIAVCAHSAILPVHIVPVRIVPVRIVLVRIVPVHIVMRGHSREPVFFELAYAAFPDWLGEMSRRMPDSCLRDDNEDRQRRRNL